MFNRLSFLRVLLVVTTLIILDGCTKDPGQGSEKESDKVTYAFIVGDVQDGNDRPLSGVLVTLYGDYSDFTHTDSRGEFSFDAVLPGDWRMVFTKKGYGTAEIRFKLRKIDKGITCYNITLYEE